MGRQFSYNDSLFKPIRLFWIKWCINSPTRVTPTTESAIDNVISNIEGVTVSVINTSIADHYGQEAVILGLSPEREPAKVRTTRNTNPNNNYQSLKLSTCQRNLGVFK